MTGQALVTRFKADVSGAKADISALAAVAQKNMLTISQSALRAASDMESLSPHARNAASGLNFLVSGVIRYKLALAGIAGAVIAFGAINGILDDANARIEKLTQLADKASAAGVGTTFFQAWTQQAKQLGTEASTLERMLTNARNAAAVRLGEGDTPNGSALGRRLGEQAAVGNIGAGDVSAIENAGDQELRIRLVLDLIERLRNEGRDLAALDIGRAMFGSDFENRLRAGVDMVGAMKAALDGMASAGGERIVSREEVARAVEINAKIEETRRIMVEGLKPVHDDIARISLNVRENWAGVEGVIGSVIAKAGELYGLLGRIEPFFNKLGNADVFKDAVSWLRRKGLVSSDVVFNDQMLGPDLPPGWKPPEAANALGEISVAADRSNPLRPNVAPSRAGSSAGPGFDNVEAYINSLTRNVEVLRAEAEAYGKSNTEKARAVDLARAQEAARVRGTPLTDAETAAVLRLADAEGTAKTRLDDLRRAAEQSRDQMQFFGDTLVSTLEAASQSGANAQQIFANLARTLASSSLRAVIMGQGPLAGLLGMAPAKEGGVGGLLGMLMGGLGGLGSNRNFIGQAAGAMGPFPQFADGGMIGGSPGQAVPITAHAGEIVLNAAQQRAVASRMTGAGPVDNSRTYQIDARGAQMGVGEQIARALQAYDSSLPDRLSERQMRGV